MTPPLSRQPITACFSRAGPMEGVGGAWCTVGRGRPTFWTSWGRAPADSSSPALSVFARPRLTATAAFITSGGGGPAQHWAHCWRLGADLPRPRHRFGFRSPTKVRLVPERAE